MDHTTLRDILFIDLVGYPYVYPLMTDGYIEDCH